MHRCMLKVRTVHLNPLLRRRLVPLLHSSSPPSNLALICSLSPQGSTRRSVYALSAFLLSFTYPIFPQAGYTVEGEKFLEDGADHIRMVKKLQLEPEE